MEDLHVDDMEGEPKGVAGKKGVPTSTESVPPFPLSSSSSSRLPPPLGDSRGAVPFPPPSDGEPPPPTPLPPL
eukprot:scaffold421576_cov71-Attheya_sp.AAC.1